MAGSTTIEGKTPIDLLEISQLLSLKIKNSDCEEFFMLKRYAKYLLLQPKYNVTPIQSETLDTIRSDQWSKNEIDKQM